MKKIRKITTCILALVSLCIFLKDKNTTQAFSATGFHGLQVTPYQFLETLHMPEGINRSYLVTHIGNRVVIYPVSYSSFKAREDIFRFDNLMSNRNFCQKTLHPASYCASAVYSQIVPNANFINDFPIMFINNDPGQKAPCEENYLENKIKSFSPAMIVSLNYTAIF